MAKSVLLDEFHLGFRAPPGLPEAAYLAMRRALDGRRFRAGLRRAVRGGVPPAPPGHPGPPGRPGGGRPRRPPVPVSGFPPPRRLVRIPWGPARPGPRGIRPRPAGAARRPDGPGVWPKRRGRVRVPPREG